MAAMARNIRLVICQCIVQTQPYPAMLLLGRVGSFTTINPFMNIDKFLLKEVLSVRPLQTHWTFFISQIVHYLTTLLRMSLRNGGGGAFFGSKCSTDVFKLLDITILSLNRLGIKFDSRA